MQIVPEIRGRPNCAACLARLGKCNRHNPQAECSGEAEEEGHAPNTPYPR